MSNQKFSSEINNNGRLQLAKIYRLILSWNDSPLKEIVVSENLGRKPETTIRETPTDIMEDA